MLVLATVVVVLLAMLGAGFVQMSRLDRVATNQMDNRSQDYEGSILRYLGGILAGDVRDPDSDEYLTNDMEKYDYPWTNAGAQELLIEKWLRDYDVTELQNYVASVYPATNLDGELVVDGGSFDDTWLASIEPEFPPFSAAPFWPHLTNLNGIGVDLRPGEQITRADGSVAPGLYAVEASVTPTNEEFRDTAVSLDTMVNPTNEGLFADADGDGIPDARWTWAPLPEQFGLTYVMAVRIIDNSALADINTWTIQSNAGGAYSSTADEVVRWYWPGDLDLAQTFIGNLGSGATNGGNVINDLMSAPKRNIGFTGAGRANPKEQYRGWLRGARLYDRPQAGGLGDYATIGAQLEKDQPGTQTYKEDMTGGTNFNRFARINEAELRWRNGTNRSSDNLTPDPTTPIEAIEDDNFWRDNRLETDAYDTLYPPPPPPSADVSSFFLEEPRKRMTIYSGSSDRGKANLNFSDGEDISEVLRNNMEDYPRISDLNIWPGPDTQAFGDRAAAAVVDFRDTDNELTLVGDAYGMEYLPFVSEVYLQGRYQSAVTPATPPLQPNDVVTWTHTPGNYAAMIELVNPWPWPIRVPDVQVVVENLTTGDEDLWGDLPTLLAGLPTVNGNPILEGHQRVALKQEDPGHNAELLNDIPGGYRVFDITAPNWPVAGTAADIETDTPAIQVSVHLRATADDDNRVQYQSFKSVTIPPTVDYEYTAGNSGLTGGEDGYFQHWSQGTADGLSALTVRRQDVEPAYRQATGDANRQAPAAARQIIERDNPQAMAGEYAFDTAAKGAASPAADAAAANNTTLDDRVEDSFAVGALPDPRDEAFVIGNAGVIYRSGDLARIVLLGPTTTQTVAEVWTQATANFAAATGGTWLFHLNDFLINPLENFAGSTAPITRYNLGKTLPVDLYEERVTYGMELLDRVTTLSPAEDQLDNDGDSRIDDEDEQLIPGRINLNTASRDTLARSLPLAPAVSDYASLAAGPKLSLIDLILRLRADPDVNAPRALSGRQADHPGIAWMGELLESEAGGGPSVLADSNNFAGLIEDFNEYEQGVPSALDTVGIGPGDDDEFTNDREQFLTMLANLNQVASVRSDVFTAYVLVRGYPSSDFSNGGTNDPVEEYRIIATFDRSVIHEARPLPKLRSVTVYRQN
ncbi:MAG: hypothetical protein AAF800_00420 [Planctomycetota bacterium]